MYTVFKPDSESLMQFNADSAKLFNQLSDLLNEYSTNTTNITNNTNIINTINNTNITNTTDVANTTGVVNTTNITNTTDVANTTNIDSNNDDDEDAKKCCILDLLIEEVEEDELADKFGPACLFICILTGQSVNIFFSANIIIL